MLPELPPSKRELLGEEEEEALRIDFDEKTFFFASSSPKKSPRDAVKNILDIEKRKKMKTKSRRERERGDEDGTTTTTTTTTTIREKYNRLLLKHQTLKRDFRKLSEDYDYNFALFKERDEELDSLEEQLSVEKKKNRAYRDRIKELEREVALRTL